MNTTTTDSNTTAFDGQSVLAVSFQDDQKAYNAMTALKELDAQQRIDLREAVVAFRGDDGQVTVKDQVADTSMRGTAGGGLIGLLLGVLGGPVGVLIGGTYGLFVGSLFDLGDAGDNESALAQISGSVRVGHTALLAVVDEPSPDVIDAAMSDLGGSVARRPVADVQAEIAAAEDAQRAAKREARKELMRQRKERDKAAVDAKVEELKGKLHHGSEKSEAVPAGTAS
jgi:uncharacterized membrane protein